jgi:hypothetical protein
MLEQRQRRVVDLVGVLVTVGIGDFLAQQSMFKLI